MNKTISIIASVVLSFALFFAYTNSGLVFAQNQSSATANNSKTSSQNQTLAALTGKAQTTVIQKTAIPAEQTSVTVNQSTKPVQSNIQLQPLTNQTIQQQLPNISSVKNQTMVQATGPATTTIINKTTVPFNQTTLGIENSTKSPQVSQQNQSTPSQTNQSAQGQSQNQSQQQQQNQSKGPLDQLGASVGKLIGQK